MSVKMQEFHDVSDTLAWEVQQACNQGSAGWANGEQGTDSCGVQDKIRWNAAELRP
jgi:hypothetical protein